MFMENILRDIPENFIFQLSTDVDTTVKVQ